MTLAVIQFLLIIVIPVLLTLLIKDKTWIQHPQFDDLEVCCFTGIIRRKK